MTDRESLIEWPPPSRVFDTVEKALGFVYKIATILAALVALGIMVAGFYECGRGLAIFAGLLRVEESVDAAAVTAIIHGIELVLLAPLLYFVVVSLDSYVHRLRSRRVETPSRRRLLSVKALGVSLLITIIATDLTGELLTRPGLEFREVAGQVAVLVVLAGYMFGLEFVVSERQSARPE